MMNRIKEFVAQNDVDIVNNQLQEKEILDIFALFSFKPGAQMLEFMNNYSYLAYGSVEFFGINAKRREESSVVKRTCVLYNKYPATRGYFLIEHRADGYYVFVDPTDTVYNFFAGESEAPEKTDKCLADYILQRFSEAVI